MGSRLFEAVSVNEPTAFPTTEPPMDPPEESGGHGDTRLREDWLSIKRHLVHSRNGMELLVNENRRQLDGAFQPR